MLLYFVSFVLNVKICDDVQIVIIWVIMLLVVVWWLFRLVLIIWKGVVWVVGIFLVVMMCIQVCKF